MSVTTQLAATEDRGPGEPLFERATSLLERDILAGVWPPDSRLGIKALTEHYGLSATPLREGLSRLAARGLIRSIGQKGFRVSPVSRTDLADITRLRTIVEIEAVTASMRDGGDEWEAGIVAALHRLRRSLEREPETMREGSAAFDALHRAFHRSLLAACGSPRLLHLHDELYMQAYRYRRVMMGRLAEPDWFIAEHEALAGVVLARRRDEAVESLSRHLQTTLEVVYGAEGRT